MKAIGCIVVVMLLIGCKSTEPGKVVDRGRQIPASSAITVTEVDNTFHGIPVYTNFGSSGSWGTIKDGWIGWANLLESEYANIMRSQQSKFINFKITSFDYEVDPDSGDLIIRTHRSWDQTPAEGNSFYPANPDNIKEWKILSQYHSHGGGRCSIYRYSDILRAELDLAEMRKDPNLDKVYQILLSVATDIDYDYPAIGRAANFTPGVRKEVCDGYADELILRLNSAGIPGVTNTQKIAGQNHAWVYLNYKGKTLALDATWFDTNNIMENGYVDHNPHKQPMNITFNTDIFTNHGAHHIQNGPGSLGS
jgi:hypothetical protein